MSLRRGLDDAMLARFTAKQAEAERHSCQLHPVIVPHVRWDFKAGDYAFACRTCVRWGTKGEIVERREGE